MAEDNNKVQSNLVSTSSLAGTIGLTSTILSNTTRLKLKDLGVDTDDIKTEEEGQAALKEAEELLESEKAEAERVEKQKKADENLHYRLRKLAREIGIPLNEYESVSKMIEKMTRKVKELRADSQDDSVNLRVNKQKNEYQDILNRYLQSQKQEQMLDDNLKTIAYYNKLYQQMNF